MEHSFNVQFAQKYGIEEAIIVHNFYFWLGKNIANEKHLHNGRYWTYNSNNAFTQLFPYINKTKIFRVLKHLEECDIILKDNFNTSVWDKTLWYSFSDNGLCELHAFGYDVTDFVKMNHRDNQSETTIPYSKQTDSITDNKEKEDKSSKKKAHAMPSNEEHQMFEEFRKAYQGKKRGHDTEFDFFIKQNKDWREVLPMLGYAIEKENALREQARAMRKFFPEQKNMQTYLNGKNRAWEVYTEDLATYDKNTYNPQCDGVSLFWNNLQQCYITPFDVDNIADGYTKDERPDGAMVMWRGYKYIWDSITQKWIKQ